MPALVGQLYIQYISYRQRKVERQSSYNHYLDYQLIPSTDYRGKIRYFDRFYASLDSLDEDQRLDVNLDFNKALFEVGNYHRFVQSVDPLIEQVIIDNIYDHNGEKVFEGLLFKKAAALYNLRQHDGAIKILKSLINIDKDHQLAKRLLSLCIRKRGKTWYDLSKAIAIVLMFSAVSILFAELVIVSSFYLEYLAQVMLLRNVLILTASAILVSRELAMIWSIRMEVKG